MSIYLQEIKNYKWKVADDLKVLKCKRIFSYEKEAHFNVSFSDNIVYFCISYLNWITKLSKSEMVTVKEVYIAIDSDINKSLILQIKGTMNVKALSIRKVNQSSDTEEETQEETEEDQDPGELLEEPPKEIKSPKESA